MGTRRAWGIALIVIGVAGLVATAVLVPRPWGADFADDGGPGGWGGHRGPMMRGFGRYGAPGRGWPGGTGSRVLPLAENARTIDITMAETTCEPAQVALKTGERAALRFVNRANEARYLVVRGQGIWIVTQPGESVISGIRTDRQGEYAFFCGAIGQRGTATSGRITVGP
jgi:hypothetical protein